MIDYYEYIQSDQWKERSEQVKKRNGGYCEVCLFGRNFATHHRSYENLGKEKDEELLAVCECCHEMIHGIRDHFIWPSRMEFMRELQNEIQR